MYISILFFVSFILVSVALPIFGEKFESGGKWFFFCVCVFIAHSLKTDRASSTLSFLIKQKRGRGMSFHGFHPGGRELRSHPGAYENGWRCINCGASSSGSHCASCGHARTRHTARTRSKDDEAQGVPPASPQYPICGVCGRSFASLDALRVHLSSKSHQQELARILTDLASDDGQSASSSDSETGESDEEHNNKTAATDFAKAVHVGAEAAQAWAAYVAERKEAGPPVARAAEPVRSETLRPGTRVMARYYRDNLFYPATVAGRRSKRKGLVPVDFDDGYRGDVPLSDIHLPQTLEIGQEVLAHPSESSPNIGRSDYFPGRVVDNRAPDSYIIEFYNKSTMRCLRSQVIVRDFPDDQVEVEEMPCSVCGRDNPEDDGILCDGCNAVFHFTCVTPPITVIPEGAWFCPACVRARTAVPLDTPCACGVVHASPEERAACARATVPSARSNALDGEAMEDLGSVLWQLMQGLRAGGPMHGGAPDLPSLAALSMAEFAAANHEHTGEQWKPLLHEVIALEAAAAESHAMERRLREEAQQLLKRLNTLQSQPL
eukprot:m.101126 g.101126  ORF g.101126 m.101126 type:complete len:549 (-) comp14085_c1_seq6:1650-3296(-)